MALTAYETATANLLQSPGAPTTLYSTQNLDLWINSARQQLAGEGACIQVNTTVVTTVGVRTYAFSSFGSFTGGFPANSVNAPLRIEKLAVNIASGQQWLIPRSIPYFELYFLSNPTPVNGVPRRWMQFGQGEAGSITIDPPPDNNYTLTARAVGLPVTLVNDSTPEAIPYPWTDAVPYYAAYLALMSAQSPARIADAQRMFAMYTEFVQRARTFANPDVVKSNYLQSQDPTLVSKLGLQKSAQGGQ